jgi:phosphoglycolate phosphatase
MPLTRLNGATIVFDLDGTLVDTAPDLIDSCNHALADIDAEPVGPESLRPWISFGARRMIVEGLKVRKVALSEPRVDDLLQLFLAYYEANIAIHSRPFPGTVAALDSLAAAGARLAVCTNKRQNLSLDLLEALRLKDRFAAIVGRDAVPFSKPDPRHLVAAISEAGGATHRAVMVGDSEVDIATAKAARVPIVAFSFGYSDGPLAPHAPEALLDRYDDLIPALGKLLPLSPSSALRRGEG